MTDTAAIERRWTPRRRGHIYCSPGCGAGCTFAAFERAETEAAKLAKKLGRDWTPRVWENLGWHYEARSPCDRIRVSPFVFRGKIESYTAFIGDPEGAGGIWTGSGSNPTTALEEAKKQARAALAFYREFEDCVR